MGKDSAIQWTHHTFNPWRGCTKVSPGCAHCYAETLSKRNPAVLGKWGPSGTRVVASGSKWREPLAWDRAAKISGERHRVFCASLADVFEDWSGPMAHSNGNRVWMAEGGAWMWMNDRRPNPGCRLVTMDDVRDRLFTLIEATPNLDWLILTKRPENIAPTCNRTGWSIKPNVWLGTTVEDQEQADARIPILLDTPASVRFLSVEPMLQEIVLDRVGAKAQWEHMSRSAIRREWPGLPELSGINWVIVGGESGSKARPFNLAWGRSIRDQCRSARVPVFIKQMGSDPFEVIRANNEHLLDKGHLGIKDSHGGDWDEWPEDLRVREFPDPVAIGGLS